jgi:hypothetical protein
MGHREDLTLIEIYSFEAVFALPDDCDTEYLHPIMETGKFELFDEFDFEILRLHLVVFVVNEPVEVVA